MSSRPPRAARTRALMVACVLAACGGGRTAVPEPGSSRGTPPDLRGRRVMVLPVQEVVGVSGDADAEVGFGLRDRGGEVNWILPPQVEAALERSPSLDARTRGLPVGYFFLTEVDRVGDPLYGQLRRLAALVDATAVLLPLRVERGAEAGETPTVRITATVIDVRTGRVAWFGMVEGGAFEADDPRGLASAADALARTLLWYVGTG